MPTHETLGQYIRRLRIARGLTGQTVVDATGIGNSTLTYYEKDLSLPKLLLLEKVIDFLQGDFDYAWALYLIRAGVQKVNLPEPHGGLPMQTSLIASQESMLITTDQQPG
ncbi:MAG: helix-turn-helix transcriptional regulator [Anaerolineae bacterium]|nr:helix-turn-helix transcriptional regulator [Anaerolineae bacterium]